MDSEPQINMDNMDPNYVPKGQVECPTCGMELPETAQYFDRDNERPNGFKATCKQCRSEARDKDKKAKADGELIAAVDKLDRICIKALRMGTSDGAFAAIPHIATLYEELMSVFGGPKGLARHYMASYLSSKPGSQQRVKILDTMMRAATGVSDSGVAELPLERMGEDALETKRQQMEKILVEQARRSLIIHAEFEETNDAIAS
jgi:hypothetical protein